LLFTMINYVGCTPVLSGALSLDGRPLVGPGLRGLPARVKPDRVSAACHYAALPRAAD